MAINFPPSPTTNDTYSEDNLSWRFDGVAWVILPAGYPLAGSDTVTYTPAGTGAVATTVETKLRESGSPADFSLDAGIYVATTGSDANAGTSANPLLTIQAALDKLALFDQDTLDSNYAINLAAGTYSPTSGFTIDGLAVKIVGTSAIIDLVSVVNEYGFNVTNGSLDISGVTIQNGDYSGINVDTGGFVKATNCAFNSNTWRGIQSRDGGEFYLDTCTTNNNSLSGVECLLRSKGTVYNCTSNSNGWAGYSAVHSSILYVNGSTGDGNTRYCLESAGSSTLYGRDVDATNGNATSAAFLSSGSALMYLHTCTATDCDRAFMAEYGALLNGYKLSAVSTAQVTTYSAFYAEYLGMITIVTTASDPTVITNYDLAFKADYGSKIVANRTTYLTLTSVTTQSSPDTGLVDNNNSCVDMDELIGTQPKQYGTFTPTISGDTNVASSTPNQCQFSRVGNIVTVSGSVSITPTSTGDFNFNMTLPAASDITSYVQVAGSGRSYTNSTRDTIAINGDSTNDEADCRGNASTTSAQIYLFTYQYQVI